MSSVQPFRTIPAKTESHLGVNRLSLLKMDLSFKNFVLAEVAKLLLNFILTLLAVSS